MPRGYKLGDNKSANTPSQCSSSRDKRYRLTWHTFWTSSKTPRFPLCGVKHRLDKHRIPTMPGQLLNYPKQCYNLSAENRQELKSQLGELLDKGIHRPSQSSAAAAVFFVGKQGARSDWLLTTALSDVTMKNEHPAPRIRELTNRLARPNGARNWTHKPDLIKPRSRTTTVENVLRRGTECFKPVGCRLGLRGAPSGFQRLIQNVFGDECNDLVVVHSDDALIYSNSREEHIRHVRLGFQRIRQRTPPLREIEQV